MTQLYDKALKPSGLRSTQFTILAAAAANESTTISHLAEALVMERTTLTRNLRPIEKRGLVKITTGEDQRSRKVALTRRGHQRLVDALPLWEHVQAQLEEGMGKQHLQHLLEDLSATVAVAKSATHGL